MRLLQRSFLDIADGEVEVCTDSNSRHFVRHHTYWYIAHEKKNPDPLYNCIIDNLQIMANNRLSTVKWAGYEFKFERIAYDWEIVVYLLVSGLYQISWLPAAWRSKTKPKDCKIFTISL